MKKQDSKSVQAANLRKRAEEMALEKSVMSVENIGELSTEEIRKMFHELRVHQIELEMQNEELRLIQKDLAVSQANYFDLYDLAPVGYFAINITGQIIKANLTAANLLGVTRGTLAKQFITHFIIKEDQDIYYLHRKHLFETEEPQVCMLRMVRKGGNPFWARLEAIAALGDDGESVCRVVMSDIDDQKEAELKFIKLSNRQEALLDAVPDIVMEVGTDKVYTWANQSGIEFFGNDVIGREAAFYFEGEQETYQRVQEVFNGSEDVTYVESWQRRRDGEIRLLAWWCRTLKDEHGRVIGTLSSAQDITERKLAEEEMKKKSEELQNLNNYFIDREIQMIELKKEINELLVKAGGVEKYVIHTE
jgi:PAS domain S-box-containing protein